MSVIAKPFRTHHAAVSLTSQSSIFLCCAPCDLLGACAKHARFAIDKCGTPLFVDLAWPENVSAWLQYRWLLLNMGSQFRNRIILYTGCITAFLLGLCLYMIVG
uniref:Uncharacterized protein n=1 Tax=Lotharella globosa TaxID=91324 RepID=A0A7S3YJC0_9EUKA